MAIISSNPTIVALRLRTEETFCRKPSVHSDFVELAESIEKNTRHHISESTLERVWNYSTRGYSTVSLHTLNVLSIYCGFEGWSAFCEDARLCSPVESEFFDVDIINADDLQPGDRIKFTWLPDRVCKACYLGDHKFIAEECENSKIQAGDSFSCIVFQLGKPLETVIYKKTDGNNEGNKYVVGMKNGLISLSVN